MSIVLKKLLKSYLPGRPLTKGILFFFLVPSVSALIISSAASAAEEEGRAGVNPHNYAAQSSCPVCHRQEIPKLLFDPVTTCTKCHPGNVGNHPLARHPIGKVPRIHIPSILPLTKEGQMVCYTCHDPHNKVKNPNMLRIDYERLCSSCHVGY